MDKKMLLRGEPYTEASMVDDDSNIQNLSLDIDNSIESIDVNSDMDQIIDREIEFSLSIDIEPDNIVCPNCNEVNPLLPSPWATMFSREPIPCNYCGYPLK